jgi:hypothetical protein
MSVKPSPPKVRTLPPDVESPPEPVRSQKKPVTISPPPGGTSPTAAGFLRWEVEGLDEATTRRWYSVEPWRWVTPSRKGAGMEWELTKKILAALEREDD